MPVLSLVNIRFTFSFMFTFGIFFGILSLYPCIQ
jgi:hypothetical protein